MQNLHCCLDVSEHVGVYYVNSVLFSKLITLSE